ncbi:MAG: NYN domain-containing protein, partial [Spirochaetales bacterium]
IFQYPHIDKFVLITGDADFRPLLLSLRKYGKQTLIICDVTRNASEDLLKMADDFKDYRDIIDAGDSADDNEKETEAEKKLTKEQAFELLEYVVSVMLKEQKEPGLGSLKIRMKLLESEFNEKKLGYRTWKSFIDDAVKVTGLQYSQDNENKLELTDQAKEQLPKVFEDLLALLDDDTWVSFTEVAKKINFRSYGYIRFKKLALDAEKRGIVELQNKGLAWFLRTAKNY